MKIISLSVVNEEEAKMAPKVVSGLRENFSGYEIRIYTTLPAESLSKVKDAKIFKVENNQTPSIWAFLPMFEDGPVQVVAARILSQIKPEDVLIKGLASYKKGICVVNTVLPLTQKSYYDMLSIMRKAHNEATYDNFVDSVILPEVSSVEENLTNPKEEIEIASRAGPIGQDEVKYFIPEKSSETPSKVKRNN